MSALLNKRLFRSLWRTKLRLLAVVFMVSVGVFAGLTFGGYSHNLDGMYDSMQADNEDGANLADIWIDNRTTSWSPEQVQSFCNSLEDSLAKSSEIILDSCEGRTIIPGAMFHGEADNQQIINSLIPCMEYIFIMCHKIGLPPISTIGLGRVTVSSLNLVPKPPAKITNFNLNS